MIISELEINGKVWRITAIDRKYTLYDQPIKYYRASLEVQHPCGFFQLITADGFSQDMAINELHTTLNRDQNWYQINRFLE